MFNTTNFAIWQVASETEAEESITSLLCSFELSDNEEQDHQNEESEEEQIGGRSREINRTIIMEPGVSLQLILDSFSEAEETEYQNLVAAMATDAGGGDDDDDDETNSEQKYLNHYSYLEKPLYDLLEKIDLGDDPDSPFQGIEMDSPTVLVAAGRYLVSEKLAETFTKIFDKHGDVAGKFFLFYIYFGKY